MIVHICGAPGAGKSTLAQRLSEAVGLPVVAVDDERRKLLAPGEHWPRNDSDTWAAMKRQIAESEHAIVETMGGSAKSRDLLRGQRVFTILCKARPIDRYHRLRKKSMSGDPLVGDPRRYLAAVTRILEPQIDADQVWDGRTGDFDALVASVRAFTGDSNGRSWTRTQKGPQTA